MGINRIILLILIIICFSCGSSNKELSTYHEENWKEIVSEKGNFRIEFPPFEVKIGNTIYLAEGDEKTIYYYSINTQNTDDDNLAYRVDYSFWPRIETTEQIN